MFRKLHVCETRPIETPGPIPGIASEGYMALSRVGPSGGSVVYGRGVPENTIFRAKLSGTLLSDLELVVSAELFPDSPDGRKVVGYEDPTYYDGLGREPGGFFCTMTVPKFDPTGPDTSEFGWDAHLAWVSLDREGGARPPVVIMTGEGARKLGVSPDVDLVKEAEPWLWNEGDLGVLLEYGDINHAPPSSSIGFAWLSGGRAEKAWSFWTAQEDWSEHVSTAGVPMHIGGRGSHTSLCFINRRREREWSISWMLIDSGNLRGPSFVCDEPLISVPEGAGVGPNDQRIVFASCVTRLAERRFEILYHVNDCEPWRALVELI